MEMVELRRTGEEGGRQQQKKKREKRKTGELEQRNFVILLAETFLQRHNHGGAFVVISSLPGAEMETCGRMDMAVEMNGVFM